MKWSNIHKEKTAKICNICKKTVESKAIKSNFFVCENCYNVLKLVCNKALRKWWGL